MHDACGSVSAIGVNKPSPPPLSTIQDFRNSLPFPAYTYNRDAPLNAASQMPSDSLPPDLGPKNYLAFGTIKVGVVRA